MPNAAREENVASSSTVQHADAADLETLQQINSGYMRSVQTSDVRWFDENLAADFMNSNPDGSLVDRAGFLAQMATPCVVSNFRAEDVRIRILGDIAIIHGRSVYTNRDGHPGAGRYTDVYSRRRGRWLCVSAHVTRG
jgi:ketosteroid isomerase-like protein